LEHEHDSTHIAHGKALLDLLPETEATHVAVQSGNWFSSSTWAGGSVPSEGAKVLIPEDVEVLYSGRSDAKLDVVRIDGTIEFATNVNSKMVVDTMITSFNSKLSIGSVGNPVSEDVKIELIIADNGPIDTDWDPSQVSRGLIALGEVEMHGEAKTVHLKVDVDPLAGNNFVELVIEPLNWKVGDKIVIAGTKHEDFRNDGSRISQDEVRIITKIEGNKVFLNEPLAFDHASPADHLSTSVANYTRNIVISSENGEFLEANERGHTMFMHNADVDVRYVEFDELGRTDKSERLDDFALKQVERTGPNSTVDYGRIDEDGDGKPDSGEMTNIRGRYAVHFHEAGNAETDQSGYMEGNALWGSPGWGYVNHSSQADFINNAAFNVFGASFVGEAGNETGLMKGNISIFNHGTAEQFETNSDSRAAFHGTLNQDMGYAGFGFWFNGRQIELEDNVSAGAGEAAFGWTTRGVDQVSPSVSSLPNELLGRGHQTMNHADDGVISVFDNNEAISTWKGFLVDGLGATKNHNGYNMITDFTGWGIEKSGIEISYSSKYIIEGMELYSDEVGYDSRGVGVRIALATEQVMVSDASIEGFRRGVVNVNNTHSTKGDAFIPDRDINLVNVDIIGNVGAAVETTQKRAGPTHVFDSFENLPNFDLDLIFDDQSLRLTNNVAENRNMFPTFSTSIQKYKNQEGMMVEGTKFDSLGATDYPFGNEMSRFDRTGVNEILSKLGYHTLLDGTKVVVLGEMITDRLTGETRDKYFVTELPIWWKFDGRELDNGSYVQYADVYRPGFIASENVPAFSLDSYSTLISSGVTETDGQDQHSEHQMHGDDSYEPIEDPSHEHEEVHQHEIDEPSIDLEEIAIEPDTDHETDMHHEYDPVHQDLELKGGVESDVLTGGSGNDVLRGRLGDDIISANEGDDLLFGGAGGDQLDGGMGSDTLAGGGGQDILIGGSGNDVLDGMGGRDDLDGGLGNDIIDGGAGRDELRGDKGDDFLHGGSANDRLWGGVGADTFVFEDGFGLDRIFDFEIKVDKIDLSALSSVEDFAEVSALTTQNKKHTLIELDEGVIVLRGFEMTALDENDFLF